MRKLIESTLVSVDGVVASPPLWAMEYRDKEVDADSLERFLPTDAMLLGRGTYDFFAEIWPSMTSEFADRVNGIRKYVFSSTLEKAEWNNSTIVRGDVKTEVTKLKREDGGDMAIFGHGRLAQTLLESGLTDELRLSVHPVLAGQGGLLFRPGAKRALRLVEAKTLGTGVVVLSYRPLLSAASSS
jgi:dihydrofolate reductase